MSADASEVFTADEIARAAGVPARVARELIRSAGIAALPGGYVAADEAVDAVKLLRGVPLAGENGTRQLFSPPSLSKGRSTLPLAASAVAHGGVLVALALAATIGIASPAVSRPSEFKPVRMVFLAIPGPGGGGGGGGLRQPAPARSAQLRGTARMRSPVPVSRAIKSRTSTPAPRSLPPPPRPVERPVEPPPPAKSPDPAPPVAAPVASLPADPVDRPGVLDDRVESASRGSGEGGGSGSGTGSGIGEGTGPGIGPGSGGGTGGGPYRPGSGVTPPGLLHEVKPDYTEEARRNGVEGEVVLEIVVRSDGSVGNIRVLRGLGAGLDQRAADAVRQWRFSPARRQGVPVDVMVEVEVEFRIR